MNNALHLQEVVLKQTAEGFFFLFKVAAFSQGMPLVRQGKDQKIKAIFYILRSHFI